MIPSMAAMNTIKHFLHRPAPMPNRKKRRYGNNSLLKEVQDFKAFIEKDGKVLMGFREMSRAKITGVCNLLSFFLTFNH